MISMSSVLLAQELFIARGLETDQSFLLGIFLMVQFVAIFGALIFERLAYAITTKRAILVSLVLWCGVVIYGYGFLKTTTDAWAMGSGNRDCSRWLASTVAVTLLAHDSQKVARPHFSAFTKSPSEALPGWVLCCLGRWWQLLIPTGRRCCR